MQYRYEDAFLVKKVSEEELGQIELAAIEEAQKLGITDAYYMERYVKARVYVEIAQRHIEADGMKEKLDVYKDEMDRYYRFSQTNSPSNIATIPVARG
ncbi:MAG: hypothetical protein GXO16_03155 [Epsilonproteobacteria bacterium]|nr:hypothetical protein [Campylobacterota bacterium]